MLEFYRGKRVFITGHTGFKGSWLCHILINAGAEVTGFALEAPELPALFRIAREGEGMRSLAGDIRDAEALRSAFDEAKPELVFHLAAQPIVRDSYANPAYTYETNVMGTVNLLECVRKADCVRSLVNVTTDKVYLNREWAWGYRETDRLDGYDPYSNSKSCSELVTHSYVRSFLTSRGVAVSTARAGNVIGGGDFAADRIIPDCVRAALKGENVRVRNPFSVRPYQHVLEPLFAYLLIAQRQYEDFNAADSYNVGPDDADCVSTGELAGLFCAEWENGLGWEAQGDAGPHEAGFLRLDCSRIKHRLGWQPKWGVRDAVHETVAWTKCWQNGESVREEMDREIKRYVK